MNKKLVLFLAFLLLVSTVLTSVCTHAQNGSGQNLFGMHEDIVYRHLSDEKLNISRAFEELHSLGVHRIREPIWRWYMNSSTTFKNETIKNAVKYVMHNASLLGIDVMAYVQDFPYWMTLMNESKEDQQIVPHRNMTEGSEYRQFLERYEESWETLAREFPEIMVWEIGNEYNLPEFLHPLGYNKNDNNTWFNPLETLNITTDLLYYGSRGINASNSNATTVLCGLGPGGNGIHDIEVFLNSTYVNIESGRWPSTNPDDFFEVACWHPYIKGKPTDQSWVDPNKAVYEVMKNHGDANKRVVFSEMGFSDNCTGLSKEEIADYLLETFRLAKDNFPWLDTIYWFRLTDRDPTYDPNLNCSEYGYGVVATPRENLLWKPAAYAYACGFMAIAFGSRPGDPSWNLNADLNNDGVVDIFDVVLLAQNFRKTT